MSLREAHQKEQEVLRVIRVELRMEEVVNGRKRMKPKIVKTMTKDRVYRVVLLQVEDALQDLNSRHRADLHQHSKGLGPHSSPFLHLEARGLQPLKDSKVCRQERSVRQVLLLPQRPQLRLLMSVSQS